MNRIKKVGNALYATGQLAFEWPAPNGYPDVEGAWLNTGGLLARWNWTGDVIGGAFPPLTYDTAALRATLYGKTAGQIYDLVAEYLLLEAVTDVGAAVLNNQLSWSVNQLPTNAQVDAALPTIVIAVLSAADAQYR